MKLKLETGRAAPPGEGGGDFEDQLIMFGFERCRPYTLHSVPYTLHPTPYTPHPSPYGIDQTLAQEPSARKL
jgi:hypothetical protein